MRQCLCGCGQWTRGGRYRPGHDARHVSQLIQRIKAGTLTVGELTAECESLSPALIRKVHRAFNPDVPPTPKPDRYRVDGLNLLEEMHRLVKLPAFGGPTGKLAQQIPTLKVRYSSNPHPARLGFARPARNLIHITIFKRVTADSLRETLVHELAHLHVGSDPDPITGKRRWHGWRFQETMVAVFAEAYGVKVDKVRRHSYGGEFAAALRADNIRS